MNSCKLVIIHSGNYAKNEYVLENVCKAPKLLKNFTWTPESSETPPQFGLGCSEIPFNIVITRNGKIHNFKNTPSAFGEFPEAYHILLEGNADFFDKFNNQFTLNQRNTLMRILKEYFANGFEITPAYRHDSSTYSPGFVIEEIMVEKL